MLMIIFNFAGNMGPCPNDMISSKTRIPSEPCTTVLKGMKKKQVAEVEHTTDLEYTHKYVWRNIIFMLYAHIGAFYGLYLLLTEARRILLFGEYPIRVSSVPVTVYSFHLGVRICTCP